MSSIIADDAAVVTGDRIPPDTAESDDTVTLDRIRGRTLPIVSWLFDNPNSNKFLKPTPSPFPHPQVAIDETLA